MGLLTVSVIFLMVYVETIRGKPWTLFDEDVAQPK